MRIRKNPVEGAVLQIEDLQGKVIVEKWKTENEPKQIEKLPEGEYVLVEAEAPFGYQKAEKMKFRVEPRKEVQKIILIIGNQRKRSFQRRVQERRIHQNRRYSDSRKAHCGVAWSFSVTWIDLLQKAEIERGRKKN